MEMLIWIGLIIVKIMVGTSVLFTIAVMLDHYGLIPDPPESDWDEEVEDDINDLDDNNKK